MPQEAGFVVADLRTADGVKALSERALQHLGGIDIVVNNAGAVRPHLGGTTSVPDSEWQDSFDINLMSAVRVSNALIPALKESSAGVIINVSAVNSRPPAPPMVHYGALKAALNAYTAALAQELAASKIRVNTVTPGGVITPGGDEVRQLFLDAMGGIPAEALFQKLVPLGRPGEAWEIAETVAYLVSDRASWVTGANYFIDGGMQVLA
jgi:NAD(P)-dependent dehydrogenase (short-subunit alcohol dehydrogenase family)